MVEQMFTTVKMAVEVTVGDARLVVQRREGKKDRVIDTAEFPLTPGDAGVKTVALPPKATFELAFSLKDVHRWVPPSPPPGAHPLPPNPNHLTGLVGGLPCLPTRPPRGTRTCSSLTRPVWRSF